MGRSSSSSCLKIIACGSDTAENEDIDSPETKVSGDKRGWSFRKRFGRHRLLGSHVRSETVSLKDKEIPLGINTEFQEPVKSNSSDEKSQLPKPVEKVTEAAFATERVNESKPSVVITSENDDHASNMESKLSEAEMVVENGSNATSVEAKETIPVVISGNDNVTETPEAKISNADVIVSDVDSKATSAESETFEPAIVPESDGGVGAIMEVDTNATSAESETFEPVIVPKSGGDVGAKMEDSLAITVQSAIRGFLAQREFVRLKSAIKLQAAIRGHLVRRDAVGTLHYIRAVVKVQAFVRAHSSKSLVHKNKSSEVQFSSVRLLKNGFARQLLESTPQPKSRNIRFDPLSPNATWSWLERWMSILTSEDQKVESMLKPEYDNQVRETALPAYAEPIILSDPTTSKLSTTDLAESQECEENHVIGDVSPVDSEPFYPLSKEVKTEPSLPKNTDKNEDDVASLKMDAPANRSSETQAEPEPISLVDVPALENEVPKPSSKRPAPEELDGEGKKFVCGSRKASNPAFIAAQSKFKELSGVAKLARSGSSSHQDLGAVSHIDAASSVKETFEKINEPSTLESAVFVPQNLVGGSECGTELSISSTLDSPVRSDLGNTEMEQNKFFDDMTCDLNSRDSQGGEVISTSKHSVTDLPSIQIQQEDHRINGISVDTVAAMSPQEDQKHEITVSDMLTHVEPVNSLMDSNSSQMEQKHKVNGSTVLSHGSEIDLQESVSSVMDSNFSQMEQKHEVNVLNVQLEYGSEIKHQEINSSLEASPKSHRIILESQETPSSQVSVKSKKNKIDRSGSNTKHSSFSAGKRLSPNPGGDSGDRSSTENLPKDHKSGKRRNSFGSSKSDNVDHDPKDSSARASLPSYMQATESARAKAHSPRSSPDVHDKEFPIKKRHSLPGASGRQGSLRIQRSSSQAAQSAKVNGSNERKWQR